MSNFKDRLAKAADDRLIERSVCGGVYPARYSVELRRATRAGQFFYTINNPQGGSFGSNQRGSRKAVLALCARSIPADEMFQWFDWIGDQPHASGVMAGTKVPPATPQGTADYWALRESAKEVK